MIQHRLLAALLLASPLAAQTAPTPTVAQAAPTPNEAELLRRIEAQDATIQALTERLDAVTKVLATRVDKVEAASESGKIVMTSPSLRAESPSGDFSLQFVGTVQPEVAFYAQSRSAAGAPLLGNGTGFRRAHFGVQGSAFGDFGYQLIFDGAASGGFSSGVRDAVVSYNGLRPFIITIGNQKTPGGLEAGFSDRSNALTFLEPGLVAALATVNGQRAIGVKLASSGAHYAASVGVFGDDIANAGVQLPVAEGWGVHGRASVAPLVEPGRVLHFGVSGYTRAPGNGRANGLASDPLTSVLRYRSQPEVTVDASRMVDTGFLTHVTRYSFAGGEAAAVFGPLSVQGEVARSWVDQSGGRVGLRFDAAYALASLFLTGESRVYDVRTGQFGRLRPTNAFDKGGGWGAFEVAARWSRLDLDSHSHDLANGGVRGGVLTDTTLGVNWYLNAWLRVMANYIHADSNKLSAAGIDQGTTADIFALRLHQEW